MFGSIRTTLIETFDECYVVVTKVVAATANATLAAARPQGGNSVWYLELINTKPLEIDGT